MKRTRKQKASLCFASSTLSCTGTLLNHAQMFTFVEFCLPCIPYRSPLISTHTSIYLILFFLYWHVFVWGGMNRFSICPWYLTNPLIRGNCKWFIMILLGWRHFAGKKSGLMDDCDITCPHLSERNFYFSYFDCKSLLSTD